MYFIDEIGRLMQKTFPNGMETSYVYNAKGHLAELTHQDRDGILDYYIYQYNLMGNKTVIDKQRRGLPEESGIYNYGYDALGRLSMVRKNGQALRTYEYDAFGNRILLKEGNIETAYTYNAMNQLISRMDAVSKETYAYDKRGNLSLIMEDGVLKNQYTYGALNRLEQAVNGKGEAASYTYNGLGHRTGKTIGTIKPEGCKALQGLDALDPLSRLKEQALCPETRIQYTIDLTRSYHNLLQKEEGTTVQSYLWDGNVTGITGDGDEKYYLQDEMGSPIRLMDKNGEMAERYGYDEFGQDLYGNQGMVQPFGYTGYQADRIAGTYYAQAREYRAEQGRFAAVDVLKGFTMAPYTLNEYEYCWNNPEKYIDLNGKTPGEIVKWGTGLAFWISQLDTPAPGPADAVALGVLAVFLLVAGGVAIYEYATTKAKTKTKEEEKAIAITKAKKEDFTFIYRRGSGNKTNLTPREIDINGLSYSLTPPIGEPYTMTTIEAVNATGVLRATIDGPNHVSVYPANISELPIWIASRPTAKENPYYLTTVLSSISIKYKRGGCDVFTD